MERKSAAPGQVKSWERHASPERQPQYAPANGTPVPQRQVISTSTIVSHISAPTSIIQRWLRRLGLYFYRNDRGLLNTHLYRGAGGRDPRLRRGKPASAARLRLSLRSPGRQKTCRRGLAFVPRLCFKPAPFHSPGLRRAAWRGKSSRLGIWKGFGL